jgi:hypothetical protein
MSLWVQKRDVLLTLAGVALGALASLIISNYYYELSKDDAVKAALAEGREAGRKAGYEEAQQQNAVSLPRLIEQRYPVELVNARDAGYAAGFKEGEKQGQLAGEERGTRLGFRDGEKAGLAEGRRIGDQEGYLRGLSSCGQSCEQAAAITETWSLYSQNVMLLGESAATLREYPQDKDFIEKFRGRAISVVGAAKALQEAFALCRLSFNSTIDQLSEALESSNLPRMRELVDALLGSLEQKEGLFRTCQEGIDFANQDLRSNL